LGQQHCEAGKGYFVIINKESKENIMVFSIQIISHSDGLTLSYYKAVNVERDGIYLSLNKNKNLEYCQWFIDKTKRI
jgi:hypothetical protein